MDLHHLTYPSYLYRHAIFTLSMLVSWSILQLTKNLFALEHSSTVPFISGMAFHYMLKIWKHMFNLIQMKMQPGIAFKFSTYVSKIWIIMKIKIQ